MNAEPNRNSLLLFPPEPRIRRLSMPRHDGSFMVAWSLHAPYAGAVAVGRKPIETRTWITDYVGEIVIHGALALNAEAVAQLGEVAKPFVAEELRGTLLATAHVLRARPLVPEDEPLSLFYGPDRSAYELANVALLRPVPWKGRQGPFLVPRSVIEEARKDAPKSLEEFIGMRRNMAAGC